MTWSVACAGCGLLAAALAFQPAPAQTPATGAGPAYPSKTVRILLSGSAGGPYDDTARALAPRLTETWGQTVIVENRAGAGGTIGAAAAAKSAPDGHTLYLANAGPITINPSLQKNLPYSPRDFAPVLLVSTSPMVLVAHPSVPARTVKDLVVLARARPINYASSGIGNLQHLAMEIMQSMAKTRMTHVPYKGVTPALVDLTGGQVEVMFANILGALQFVRNGRLRAIAVSSAQRSAQLPKLPAVAETYPQFDVTTWMGIFVPVATPRDVQSKIGGDVAKILQVAEVRDRFTNLGSEVVAGPPAQLAQLIRRESELYAGVIKSIGLTPD